MLYDFVFFFKQKTAYEMRISDWSPDVCSSDLLFAVQPPQAIAQRQRLDLLQYTRKAVAHTIGLAQQTGAAPDQLFEIVGRHAEADHLCIQSQFLWRALQQLQQDRTSTRLHSSP